MFIFYHEFDSTSSGAAIVILNLIRGVLSRDKKVLLIAKVNGALHNDLKDIDTSNLTVIDNDKASILANRSAVSKDDIIVTTHYYSVYRLFKQQNPGILFYSVNITSLPVANLYFNKIHFKSLTRKLVKKIADKGGLVFVDEFAKEENEKALGVTIKNPVYLPIPVEVPAENEWKKQDKECSDLVLTYVGRAADWKIFPVRKVLKDINNADLGNRKFIFHIITDSATEFEKGLAGIDNKTVAIRYHENLPPKQLNDFLVKNSCLHFAMGTSALDGAKLGIPTVLLDFSFEEFPDDYRYSFLFSTRKYSVGGRAEDAVLKGYTMADLISLFDKKGNIEDFSNRSYAHVKAYHDLPAVRDMLLDCATDCRVHISDVSKYLVRYW